jgi:hypothetical protein
MRPRTCIRVAFHTPEPSTLRTYDRIRSARCTRSMPSRISSSNLIPQNSHTYGIREGFCTCPRGHVIDLLAYVSTDIRSENNRDTTSVHTENREFVSAHKSYRDDVDVATHVSVVH